MARFRLLALLLITGVLLSGSAWAQFGKKKEQDTNVRSVQGTVSDEAGNPISGAVVQLENMKTLQIRSYIAQGDGSYHFYDLSGDINYELRAQANGLTSASKSVSVFNSRKVVKLNLKLKKKLKT